MWLDVLALSFWICTSWREIGPLDGDAVVDGVNSRVEDASKGTENLCVWVTRQKASQTHCRSMCWCSNLRVMERIETQKRGHEREA